MLLVGCFIQTASAYDEEVSQEQAVQEETYYEEATEELIEPDSVADCPYYGIHRMMCVTNNGALLRNYPSGDLLLFNPLIYECNCGETVVCSGRPHLAGWDVGEYCVTSWYDYCDGYYSFLTTATSLPYAKTLEGYDFFS